MYCVDFEYDGIRLSDMDSIICCIDKSADITTASIGSELTLNTVTTSTANKFRIASTQYDSAFSTTFEIGKYSCKSEDFVYSEKEVAFIMRWLNRKEYHKFKPIYHDAEYSDMFLKGTFEHVNKITNGDDVIGFSLTLVTDAPYGYYETEHFVEELGGDKKFTIMDTSDETGWIYPVVKVTLKEGGDFEFINSRQDPPVRVKNCVAGEVLYFAGDLKQIHSSVNHKRLYNDFNWEYPKVVNEFYDVKNTYQSNLSCTVDLVYDPICKAIGI